ncbi:MAG: flagellar M-ring protein FliF [Leptospiraceae bacterium]|nr:flagellar M-ring protein FliF [Leptospiraceae bacterium]
MPEQLQAILDKVTSVWNSLDNIKKITIGGILLVIVLAFVLMGNYSSKPARVLLFDDLKTEHFSQISQALEGMGYDYSASGTSAIYVDPAQRQMIVTKLAQDDLIPPGVEGWEIFDMQKWSETTLDKEVKLHRAMKGSLEKMLMTLEFVKKAQVELSFPRQNNFLTDKEPTRASVMLSLQAGMNRDDISRKQIEGVKNLIFRAVPGLERDEISITDDQGYPFKEPDEIDDYKRKLDLARAKKDFEEKERRRWSQEIGSRLEEFFPKDRISLIRVALVINWDEIKETKKIVTPVEMTPEDPNTPYPDRKIMPDGVIRVSEESYQERFRGNGFTPGGPTGTEQQLPPGYKDLDYQRSDYVNNRVIKNNIFNETNQDIIRQPWKEEARSISVALDGTWEKIKPKEDGSGWERKYTPPDEKQIKTIEDLLKTSVLYRSERGDQILVKHLQKDRREQFQLEDEALQREMMMRRLLIVSAISIAAFVLIFLIFRAIKKEIARRRRLREEELAAQQQLMREAALRVADDGAAEVELSVDEKARREMLENAINLAREQPEQVAKLLRTWLSDES